MIQVLDRYELAPGSCRICSETKRTPSERVLDLGIVIYDPEAGWDGRVYLCETCVTEWASKFGMLSVPASDELRARNEELQVVIGTLEEELDSLRPLGAAMDRANKARAKVVAPPLEAISL